MMTKNSTLTSQAILLLLLITVPMVKADDLVRSPPTISVSGSAEVKVVPDEAILRFSIDSRETELDAAVEDNDQRVEAVIGFLKESKIEAKHIRTEMIKIAPIFENTSNGWKGQLPVQSARLALGNAPALPKPADKKKKIKPIGYTAGRSLSITINDLESFEKIYRGLIGKGVNNVSGIQFRTSELRKHRDLARLEAVKAAREKAQAMAEELGATLSAVQSINESGSPGYMFPSSFQNSSLAAPAPAFGESGSSVAAGVIEITARVQVVFLLGDTQLEQKKEKDQ